MSLIILPILLLFAVPFSKFIQSKKPNLSAPLSFGIGLLVSLTLMGVVGLGGQLTGLFWVFLVCFLLLVSLLLVKLKAGQFFLLLIKSPALQFGLLSSMIAAAFSNIFVSISPRVVPSLPDGAYVFKSFLQPVKIQWLTGNLPMDNALPYYLGEVLAKGLSVVDVDPLMPGQPASNRTFGLTAIYLFFRNILGAPAPTATISNFDYVGLNWPNVEPLFLDSTWNIFFGVANAVLCLFPILFFIALYELFPSVKNIIPKALFIGSFPYFLQHEVFTWPKMLVAGIVLLSYVLIKRNDFLMASGLLVLAWWFHPMALVAVLGLSIWMVISRRGIKNTFVVTAPIIVAYVLWTVSWALSGLRPNLVEQNIGSSNTWPNQVFARVASIKIALNLDFLDPRGSDVRGFAVSFAISGLAILFLLSLSNYLKAGRLNDFSLGKSKSEIILLGLISLVVCGLPFGNPQAIQVITGQHVAALFALSALSSSAIGKRSWYLIGCLSLSATITWYLASAA